MIVRVALFILMATGLVGFGVVAWVSAHPHKAEAEHTAGPTVLLALAHDVRAGTLLKSEDLQTRDWPATDPAPDLAIAQSARREVVGSMVRRGLAAGELLRAPDIMRPGEHGFLAAVLRPGMRAVSVAVDSVTGAAGLLWPGDRVDVILTQSLEDSTLPLGRRTVGETMLENVRVIAVDQSIVQGGSADTTDAKLPKTVTLEVGGDEAERVQVANRIGRLSLAIRSADRGEDAGTGSRAGPAAIWAGDVSDALKDRAKAPQSATVLRIYSGTADSKEFKY